MAAIRQDGVVGWPTRLSARLRTPLIYTIAAALAALAAWVTLDLWSFRWDVPLDYRGDALAVAAHIKTVIETGWYEYQPALGAPLGQTYHDYPTAENLHFMVAAVLGWFGLSWGAVMNVHFVLGFPLAAIALLWFLRRIGVTPIIGVALSVVFAIAPYHFSRGEGHLFLSWYWVVPLALGLIWSILRGDSVWGAREGMPKGLGHALGRSGGTVAILVLLGTASTYYSAFTLILGGIASLAALWVGRNFRRFLGAIAAAATLVLVLAANSAPDFIYRLLEGPNPGALQRTPVETEIYALKLTQLLLPASHHRFGPFAFLRSEYDTHYPLPSEGPALGLIAASGLIALVVVAFFVVARAANVNPFPLRSHKSLISSLAPLSFLACTALLFASVGGLSTLISFVSTSLRAWNRMSIVIAALALGAVGLLLDALVRAIASRAHASKARASRALVAASVIAVALVAGALWDQAPARDADARAKVVAEFESDAAFGAELEDQLGEGEMVFQLPYIAFPESPPTADALDSDQLRPYLHTSHLRFSGAGIRGRDAEGELAELGASATDNPQQFVSNSQAIGFAGVAIDTAAFDDRAVPAALAEELGGVTVSSPDGRFLFVPFDSGQ